MPELLLSAVSTGFMAVRFVKGGWTRQPHYLACAILGSLAAAVGLHLFSPTLDESLVAGGLAGLAGGWLAMAAFDHVLGGDA